MRRNYPLVVESAHDCIVKDVDGNEYIDFNSGIAVLNVGSTNEAVVSAVNAQVKKFTHYSYTDFYYENINELAEKLSEIYPGTDKSPKQVFYGNSGAEANEAAIKLARYHTKEAEDARIHWQLPRKDSWHCIPYREQTSAGQGFFPAALRSRSRPLSVLLQVPIEAGISELRICMH